MEPREDSLTPVEAVDEITLSEEAAPVAETPDAVVETEQTNDTTPEAEPRPATKAEVLAAAEALALREAADIAPEELSRIKQQFYALHNDELRRNRDQWTEQGNDPEAFMPMPDADEDRLKEIFNTIKEKKAAYRAAIDAEQQANLAAKRDIVASIMAMSEDTDNVHRHFQEVKDLQARFKEIGAVPQEEATGIWKQFQDAVEHYYDQHKINKELRDYDFKKNLGEKQLIIDEAVKLAAEEDVIIAFKRLQELHDKWRETGPVAKEIREELWQQFKDASAIINKRYQAHFEERKARERANEDAKTAICERVEALDFTALANHAAWESMTREIMQAQDDWKKLGFASRKMNNLLFARFRAVCDKFFAAKAAYFKDVRESMTANLEKKIALCERAEALKDSTEWRKATDEMVALQKEWKTIGAVPKKQSDAVWKRFLAACDYFFDNKKKATSGTRKAEQANLKAKRDIIECLRALDPELGRDEARAAIRAMQDEWQGIGHVPFGEKDKVYDEYRALLNELTDRYDLRRQRARMDNFRDKVGGMEGNDNKLYRERERLVRAYEQRRNELNTYENNLGFLSSKTKGGERMLAEMQRRVQAIKDDIEDLRKKIELVDAKL